MNPVTPQELRLKQLGVQPADVEEQFIRSAGNGGQNVNKVASCVVLLHRPSGIRVKAMEFRSQARNRQAAWDRLIAKLEERQARAERALKNERELARRQKRRPSLGARIRNVADKRHESRKRKQRTDITD